MKQNLVLSALLALALSGCGDDDKASSIPEENLTSTQIIQKMEQTGELPVLDRSGELAGTDANNDGIRDDIEAYIDREYVKPEQQRAVEQLALEFQKGLLLDMNNVVAVKQNMYEQSRAIQCIFDNFPIGGATDPNDVVKDLIAVSTNTKARLMAHLEFSKALDGTVLSSPDGDVCND